MEFVRAGGSSESFWRSSLWEIWNTVRAGARIRADLERAAAVSGFISVAPHRDPKKAAPSIESQLPETFFHKPRNPILKNIHVPSIEGASSGKAYFAQMKTASRIITSRKYWRDDPDAKRPSLVEYMEELGEDNDD